MTYTHKKIHAVREVGEGIFLLRDPPLAAYFLPENRLFWLEPERLASLRCRLISASSLLSGRPGAQAGLSFWPFVSRPSPSPCSRSSRPINIGKEGIMNGSA